MTVIEAKLDALMSKMGNQERGMHSTNEVGTFDENEKRNSAEEGLANEGPYQVKEAQYLNATKSYNFKPNLIFKTHYTPALRNLENFSYGEEHNKVTDLGRIFNNTMLHLGSNNNNNSNNKEVRGHKIRDKGDLLPLKNRC